MEIKEQIIQLFKQLPAKDQLDILEVLKKTKKVGDTNYMVKLALLVQEKYGKNISKKIIQKGEAHNPEITVTIFTPRGQFSATGKNKKMAGESAAYKALGTII